MTMLLFSEKRLLAVAIYFHANVFRVKLFKARYFERRICLKSTQLKQNQSKVNSANLLELYQEETPTPTQVLSCKSTNFLRTLPVAASK